MYIFPLFLSQCRKNKMKNEKKLTHTELTDFQITIS